MRVMIGLSEPEEGEDLLEAGTGPVSIGLPFSAQSLAGASAKPVLSRQEQDEVDAITSELEGAEAEIAREMLTAIKGAKSLVELQAALLAFTKAAPELAPGFTEQAAAACACCSAAGSAGANLGGV